MPVKLTNEQREQIEIFKNHIEELIEKKVTWIMDMLEQSDFHLFRIYVMDTACIYFRFQKFSVSIWYEEIYDFCEEKCEEHFSKKE